MEDRWHGPEEPTDQDSETTRKKRRGSDFLSQYLLRRKEQQGEKVEADDDEETEKKPKKFRRFFKELFKHVVEPPEKPDEYSPKHFGLEALFLGKEQTPEATIDEKTDIEPETDVIRPKTDSEEAKTNTATEWRPEQTESTIQETSEISPPTTEAAPPKLQSSSEESYSIPEESRAAYKPLDQNSDRTMFERTQVALPEKEVVIERGVGMALPVVLVGAEYLARKKADRKLESKFSEKVDRLQKVDQKNMIATEQLDTLVQQNREQLEALKRDRGMEAQQEVLHMAERAVPHIDKPKIEQQMKPQPVVEKQLESAPGVPEARETYKIMEQVAHAAENDVPVERVFERSHEVKDDQSFPTGASSIGAIMAARATDQQLPSHAKPILQNDNQHGLLITSKKVQGEPYKQAMRNGFWTAIIIIIFGTIAYLLK